MNVKNIIISILLLYTITTIGLWKKYEFNPSSMLNLGDEFAIQNKEQVPDGAIVLKGYKGDLGAGYDGQIFYYYSRTLSQFSTNWPVGFDESYRAPRIGYPFLISIFGLGGKWAAIFGMYFINIALFILSAIALKNLLKPENQYLVWFYILSPFSLGSYSVLVSDSVMVSLVILSYYFYQKEKYHYFIPTASLAVLTKEPSLFLYFPLGLYAFIFWVYGKFISKKEQQSKFRLLETKKEWNRIFIVASILIVPIIWHSYLKITFPNWRPNRLLDFILPLEGILTYLKEIYTGISAGFHFKELARLLSRFPLLILLCIGLWSVFSGIQKQITNFRAWIFRLGLILTFFMIFSAGHYHFWSIYDNVSRMFTISIPLFILLKEEEEHTSVNPYLYMSLLILVFYLIKVFFIQKSQNYIIW